MKSIAFLAALAVIAAGGARADCQDGVALALQRADALPASAGKAALLEQIQRGAIAHHEGDEEECEDQVSMASDVLDQIGAKAPR